MRIRQGMLALVLLLSLIVFGIIIVNPKWGTFVIWFFLFTYPHGWLSQKAFLPLNMGFDDLFCILLFILVLIRRNLMGGVPIRFGYGFWVITSCTAIIVVANYAGSKYAQPEEFILYVKDILKSGVFLLLFYAILHCIDNEKDLRRQFTMFSMASVAGAILVIWHYFRPYSVMAWTTETVVGATEYQGRASGAFLNANGAACVLVCSVIMVVTAVRLQKSIFSKIFIYGCIFILLMGVLVTKSRMGLLAFAVTFTCMAFVGRNKKIAWFIIIAAVIVASSFAGIKEGFQRRISRAYDPATGQFGGNVVSRIQLWSRYFETASYDPEIFLFGQGLRQGVVRNDDMGPHSVYVALVTVYGAGGVIWALISLFIFFKKVFSFRRYSAPFCSAVASGCAFALIAWGVCGLSAGTLSSQYPRYLLFYFVILLDRASYIAKQQQEWMIYEELNNTNVEYVDIEDYAVAADVNTWN